MTEATKNKLAIAGTMAVFIGLMLFTASIGDARRARLAAAREQRKETVCPSFLSIARSARDTLIVMRNEELCNRYVLDNLK